MTDIQIILDEIVIMLKRELNYVQNDFHFIEASQSLMIRNVVAVSWDAETDEYCFAFAANIEPLGAVSMINTLHKNGIHNIKLLNYYYISKIEKDTSGGPKVYFSAEAMDQFYKESDMQKREEVLHELEQNFEFFDHVGNGKHTIH